MNISKEHKTTRLIVDNSLLFDGFMNTIGNYNDILSTIIKYINIDPKLKIN